MTNSSSNPLVSIIIPAYNAQEFLSETLESILKQSYENIEIILIDDGSTDETSQIVSRYKDRVKYFFQNNSGGCAVPRNLGIQKSLGEFLCFNDADDLMIVDRVESQVDFLLKNPKVGLVFSDYINFFDKVFYPKTHFETCTNLQLLLDGKKEIIFENACPHLARENFGISSSFMMRKELSLKVPYFESSLKSSEDFHFYYRLARTTNVGIINKVGMCRRLHSYNMSSNTEKMMSECIRSYTMLLENEDNIQARFYLNKFIACFWNNLSRYNANNEKYFLAFKQELMALYSDFCLARVYSLFKSSARIVLMKVGLYKSKDSKI